MTGNVSAKTTLEMEEPNTKEAACALCTIPVAPDIVLTDGRAFHQPCYASLVAQKSAVEKRGYELKYRQRQLQLELEKTQSFFHGLLRFLGLSTLNPETVAQDLDPVTREVETNALEFNSTHKVIEGLHDHWPNYPPDWDQRAATARERAHKSCQDCDTSKRQLHVHHVKPLSRGGSNLPENLRVLCDRCHEKVHGWEIATGPDFDASYKPHRGHRGLEVHQDHPPTASAAPLGRSGSRESTDDLILRAIAEKRLIKFHYTKPDGERSVRTINPEEIRMVSSTRCVSGYCYLRRESRTFAIKRMRQLEIVHKSENEQ